jgi:hypothetical protein
MVGIGIDHISIARRLPIEASELAPVLARLRAETSGSTLRWNLGERGSCDVEVTFTRPVNGSGPNRAGTGGFVSSASLSAPGCDENATVAVSLVGCDAQESQLEFHPATPIGDWWAAHLPAYLDLAHAALEELAQELLYQHTRVRAERAG